MNITETKIEKWVPETKGKRMETSVLTGTEFLFCKKKSSWRAAEQQCAHGNTTELDAENKLTWQTLYFCHNVKNF